MPNIGKYKLYMKHLGLITLDGIVMMSKESPVAGSPINIRPRSGDTITIQFVTDETEEK